MVIVETTSSSNLEIKFRSILPSLNMTSVLRISFYNPNMVIVCSKFDQPLFVGYTLFSLFPKLIIFLIFDVKHNTIRHFPVLDHVEFQYEKNKYQLKDNSLIY